MCMYCVMLMYYAKYFIFIFVENFVTCYDKCGLLKRRRNMLTRILTIAWICYFSLNSIVVYQQLNLRSALPQSHQFIFCLVPRRSLPGSGPSCGGQPAGWAGSLLTNRVTRSYLGSGVASTKAEIYPPFVPFEKSRCKSCLNLSEILYMILLPPKASLKSKTTCR